MDSGNGQKDILIRGFNNNNDNYISNTSEEFIWNDKAE